MEQSQAEPSQGQNLLPFHCSGQLAGSGLWTRLRLQYLILAIGFAIFASAFFQQGLLSSPALLKSWDFLVVSLPLVNQIWHCLALGSAKSAKRCHLLQRLA